MPTYARIIDVQSNLLLTTAVSLADKADTVGSAIGAFFFVENTAPGTVVLSSAWTIDFNWIAPSGNLLKLATATIADNSVTGIYLGVMNTTTFASANAPLNGVPFCNHITYTLSSGTDGLTAKAFAFYA